MAKDAHPREPVADEDDPRRHFDSPQAVAERQDLTYGAKVDILQRWAALESSHEVDESQPLDRPRGSGDSPRIREIQAALDQVEAEATLDPDKPEHAPRKHGYRPQ